MKNQIFLIELDSEESIASTEYLNKKLHDSVKKEADKKFSKDSYVKNLWIRNEYKKRGGKTKESGEKPSNKKIKEQIDASEKKPKKPLNKPFRTPGGPKKFSVYVKNDKGNIVKVNFGDSKMSIKRDDPKARKSFRARHQCDTNPGPKWKSRYWSCRMWSSKPVSKILASLSEDNEEWDGETLWDQKEIESCFLGQEIEEFSGEE